VIRNSILVAIVAVLLSLLLNGAGWFAVFNDRVDTPNQPAEEQASAASFEDFVDVTQEPEAPEPVEPDEPPEVVEPDPIAPETPTTEALVASETPQDVVNPDTGDAEDGGQNADTPQDIIEPEPPGAGNQPVAPEGSPEAPPETADVAQDDVAEPVTPDAPEETVAALPELPEIEQSDTDDPQLATAVTRSLRPPAERPSQETFGLEDGSGQEPAGNNTPQSVTQRTGLELLAEAGNAVRYGSNPLSTGRATGNSEFTNYAGEVLTKLNRSPVLFAEEQGNARVQFQIDPDGSVAWVRILSSRGTPGIERAAIAQVRSAGPFPPPPEGTTPRLVFVYQNQ
jgi:TonB family protein